MKKIAVSAALAAIATISASANAATYGTTGGSAGTVGVMSIASTTATGQLGSGLKESVKVQLSNNVLGAVVFDDSTNAYGIAAGNPRGKGKAYRGSSGGGAPKEVDSTIVNIASPTDITPANLTTAAVASAGGS